MRIAKVYMSDKLTGKLEEVDEGYKFKYDPDYLLSTDPQAISLTLPLTKEAYTSNVLFPFFDGLIPEGWLLDIALEVWKLNPRDRMELLLTCCKDCIGAVSIVPEAVND